MTTSLSAAPYQASRQANCRTQGRTAASHGTSYSPAHHCHRQRTFAMLREGRATTAATRADNDDKRRFFSLSHLAVSHERDRSGRLSLLATCDTCAVECVKQTDSTPLSPAELDSSSARCSVQNALRMMRRWLDLLVSLRQPVQRGRCNGHSMRSTTRSAWCSVRQHAANLSLSFCLFLRVKPGSHPAKAARKSEPVHFCTLLKVPSPQLFSVASQSRLPRKLARHQSMEHDFVELLHLTPCSRRFFKEVVA